MQPALNFRLISMSAVYYVGNIVYDIDGISRKVPCEASPPAGDMCAKESLIPSCTLFLYAENPLMRHSVCCHMIHMIMHLRVPVCVFL